MNFYVIKFSAYEFLFKYDLQHTHCALQVTIFTGVENKGK